MEDYYQLSSQANTIYEYLFIGKIVFSIIGAIGLAMLIYGFRKNSLREKRRGIYILLFGAIIALCLHLTEIKLRSNVKNVINSYIYQ